MKGNQTIIHRPDSSDPGNAKATKKEDMAFTFDKSYWSADRTSSNYADQKTLYEDLGVELLDHSFEGYNTCIFACMYTKLGSSLLTYVCSLAHKDLLNQFFRWTDWFRKILFDGMFIVCLAVIYLIIISIDIILILRLFSIRCTVFM